MKINKNSIESAGPSLDIGKLRNFIPAPANRSGLNFSKIIGVGASIVEDLGGVGLEGIGSIDPTYANLLMMQMKNQQEMQIVSMISNNEKAKHETYMSPVRNLKVG